MALKIGLLWTFVLIPFISENASVSHRHMSGLKTILEVAEFVNCLRNNNSKLLINVSSYRR